MRTVEQIMVAEFGPLSIRTPRSIEYMAGVRAALAYRIDGLRIVRPYAVGTASADAWFAGIDEGHRLFREGGG